MQTEPRRRPVPADLFGGRLAGCFLLDLELTSTTDLSPRLRSMTFASPDLVGFEWAPGQDVMFTVPDADPPARRRYTIRRSDAAAGTIDVDVVLHGDGPFARWAAGAEPGAHIDGIGPRGAQALRADADHHVFVADETAVPAALAMLEGRLPSTSAVALLVSDDGTPTCPPPAGDADVRWLRADDLADSIAGLQIPSRTAAYVNGERTLVRDAVAALGERGLGRDVVQSKAYWRRDQANAAHGEPTHD